MLTGWVHRQNKVDAEVSHFLTNTCHKVEMVNQTEIEHLLKDSSFRNLFSVNFSPIPAAGGFRKYEKNRKHALWSILDYLNISYQPFLSNFILVSSNDSDYFPSKIITGEIYDRSISGYCDRTESAYMARITKPSRRGRRLERVPRISCKSHIIRVLVKLLQNCLGRKQNCTFIKCKFVSAIANLI